MLVLIAQTIAAILGIVTFFTGATGCTIICGIVILILNLHDFLAGLLNPLTMIIAGVIGWLLVRDFWLGVAIGLCFESLIIGVISMIAMFRS